MASQLVDEVHLRHCMRFLFDQGLKATAAAESINAVYGKIVTANKCQFWFRKFREGDTSLSDAPRSGRPSDFNEDALKDLVESDPRLTIQEMSERVSAPWSTVQEHLKKIGKVNRQGIWVPHELNEIHKQQRRMICSALITRNQNEHFLHRIVTGDEKWVLYRNCKRSRQWLSTGQTPIPTAKDGLHPKKVLLSVWWDSLGIIHYELMPPGQTITGEVYRQQLTRLNEALSQKRPALVNRKGVILLHDNARPHSAKDTQEHLKQMGWEVLPHPPYSPDLAPSDYHLFRSLEHHIRNKTYRNQDAIENDFNSFINQKAPEFFKKGIQNLVERWQEVISNDGNYILN